ncbi:MAG TPA: trypsin-like peptidase domain-containing protein, partial [Bacteroidota bacterium]|nr:trypsin-like peptidase domain-containing protein [Bacteroidota bacterium]
IPITLGDGRQATASLIGRDRGTDVAALKLEGLTQAPAELGADKSRPGEITLVIGRSPNSGPNVSMGIISAVSGPWRTWRGGELDQYIRLDATVFPGSSGGAVVDFRGKVIGIATSALSRIAGLALPAKTVNRVVDVLLKKGSVPQAYLGVALQPVPMPESFQKKFALTGDRGIMVLNIEPGGPAERGGILIGDIVLEIEGKAVDTIEDLQTALGSEKIGKATTVRVIRGGELKELSPVVGERTPGEHS